MLYSTRRQALSAGNIPARRRLLWQRRGIMVGGDEKVYEQRLPVLRAIGQNIFHMEKIGAGHMTKALNNSLLAAWPPS
jgi:3-hydroxyisobutyrate dehydrogenase-like beta-hydroxyacid dehydrogenase